MANIQDNLIGVAVPAAELSLEVLKLIERLIKETVLMTNSITKGAVKTSNSLLKTTVRQGNKLAIQLNHGKTSMKNLMQKNEAVENIELPEKLKNKFQKIAGSYHIKYSFIKYQENGNDMVSMVYRKKDADKINIVMQRFLESEKINDRLIDSDGDHVPDREDYRPLDPSIQKATDAKVNEHVRSKKHQTTEYVYSDTRMSEAEKAMWLEEKLKQSSIAENLRGAKLETFEVKKEKAAERMEEDIDASKKIAENLRGIIKEEKFEERSI